MAQALRDGPAGVGTPMPPGQLGDCGSAPHTGVVPGEADAGGKPNVLDRENDTMSSKYFDYHRFASLQGSPLFDYLDSLLRAPEIVFPRTAIERMLMELDTYDLEHTITAIEVGSTYAPADFIPHAPAFLTHSRQSVRLAASGALSDVPPQCITEELIKALEVALKDCPERKHFGDILPDMRNRMGGCDEPGDTSP